MSAADRDHLSRFYDEIFKYATPGAYVSVRGFRHRDDKPMFYPYPNPRRRFPCVQVGDPHLIDKLIKVVDWMANYPEGIVFCPPVTTFTNNQHAREQDIAEGLAISVECDQKPLEARAKIEHLLGLATVAVASGGEWLNAATGEVEPKIHLHWRLPEPTRDRDEHRLLKHARRLAAQYVSADNSASPIVHPLRWPGSWHRKDANRPRLAKIIAVTSNEIELADALELLQSATIDFGDDAGRGLENITSDELPTSRSDDHWQQLAKGIDKDTTGRIDAVISLFGYLLHIGVEPHLAVSLAHAYNRIWCRPALDEGKVDRALESIIKRELSR